jgi:acetamidase/formamidase
VPLRGPLGETDTTWIVIGFAGNLDDALVACLRETIHWLAEAAQITQPEAYALASMAVSFRVTQYANQTGSAYSSIPPKAVHAVIPKSVFPAEIQQRIGAWLRPETTA